jgi:H+/Cl- antiporter ClcA
VSVGIQFGEFDSAEYRTYELIFFGLMGVAGGAMGAVFNKINEKVTYFRIAHLNSKLKKISELLALTCIWTLISFIIPLCWRVCTPKPSQTAKVRLYKCICSTCDCNP